jgi:hypothetical protein
MGKTIGDIGAALSANSSHCGYIFSESHGMWTTGDHLQTTAAKTI